jgi:hypothetical protein
MIRTPEGTCWCRPTRRPREAPLHLRYRRAAHGLAARTRSSQPPRSRASGKPVVESSERTASARHLRSAFTPLGPSGPGSTAICRAIGQIRTRPLTSCVVPGPQRHHRVCLPRLPRPRRAGEPGRALLHQPRPDPAALRPRPRLGPRLAQSWLEPVARWLGAASCDDRLVPLVVQGPAGPVSIAERSREYIAIEHTVGRLLDLGIIVSRVSQLFRWTADELQIPEVATTLVDESTPSYAWDPSDREPWAPHPTRLSRVVRSGTPTTSEG